MDVDLNHHPWFASLPDCTSSIPERSPLPGFHRSNHITPHIRHTLKWETVAGLEIILKFSTASSQHYVLFCTFVYFPQFFKMLTHHSCLLSGERKIQRK